MPKHPKLVLLGSAIRTVREDKGLSQDELALRADVDRSHFGHIERGAINAAFLTLVQIADALDVEVADLIPTIKDLRKAAGPIRTRRPR